MHGFVAPVGRIGTAKRLRRRAGLPSVLITGACRGFGRACAEVLAAQGSELLLCDIDDAALAEADEALGAAGQFHCDVASEASVAAFAAELLGQRDSLDMIINAAGGGYERTLGMYRVSRALMGALQRGGHGLLVNVPPSPQDADAPAFPYASSRLAFQRLSSALAFEARGTDISVLVACPGKRELIHAMADPDAGTWVENHHLFRPSDEDNLAMACEVALLLDDGPAPALQAG